jgi:hypothetical protein
MYLTFGGTPRTGWLDGFAAPSTGTDRASRKPFGVFSARQREFNNLSLRFSLFPSYDKML